MSYRTIRSIGRGGMAEVFLAQAADGSDVVLKRLLPMHRDNQDFLRMFRIEGEVGLAVRHRNVVRTLAFDQDTDGPYIALEYLRGMDLRSLRRKLSEQGARLPLASVLYVMTETLDALHAAHVATAEGGRPLNVVHRDVSPSNVILTETGHVKLIDFGVARRDSTEESTRAGVLKGKIAYMAPEQLRHEVPDRRADVYSAGIMLYELLLGRRPYAVERPGEFELMLAIVRHAVTEPAEIDPHFPADLARLVMHAMALLPEQRYPSAASFAEALRAYARQRGLELRAADIVELVDAGPALAPDPEPESLSLGRLLGPGAPWITPDLVDGVAVLTLEGSVDSRFPGAALGTALSGDVLLDLHGVDRVTPSGIATWMALLAGAERARLGFVRMSEAIVDRVADVPGFLGHGLVLSFEARMRCRQCGHFASKLMATSGLSLPQEPCDVCGGVAVFDDRGGTFDLLQAHGASDIPVELARAAKRVETTREVRAIEKRIDADATRVRVRAALPPNTRLDRLFQGIEGKLVLDLGGLRDASPALGARFAQALQNLEPEVTEVHVEACPKSLYDALGGANPTPRLHVDDIATTLDCPTCGPSLALPWRPWRNEALLCARCGKAPTVPVVVKPTSPRRAALLVAAALCLVLAAWLVLRVQHG